MVKNRIKQGYTEMEAQLSAKFRAGRSTVDFVFTITELIENRIARNPETHLSYIDLKKAYDSVRTITI